MNTNIRNRLLIILVLVAASVWALWPRTITIRERNPKTGEFHDTTRTRVPLKRGLDLQGGMYLALEVDDSKGVVQNKGEAIDRALKVVRNRIDEFGVSEPVVQKVGNDRIVVELPGIDDAVKQSGGATLASAKTDTGKAASPLNLFSAADSGKAKNDSSKSDT